MSSPYGYKSFIGGLLRGTSVHNDRQRSTYSTGTSHRAATSPACKHEVLRTAYPTPAAAAVNPARSVRDRARLYGPQGMLGAARASIEAHPYNGGIFV